MQRGLEGITARAPWIVAFTFGLMHGLGFAGGLSEAGLPAGHIPTALSFFSARRRGRPFPVHRRGAVVDRLGASHPRSISALDRTRPALRHRQHRDVLGHPAHPLLSRRVIRRRIRTTRCVETTRLQAATPLILLCCRPGMARAQRTGMLLTILFVLTGVVGAAVLLVEVRAAMRRRSGDKRGPK